MFCLLDRLCFYLFCLLFIGDKIGYTSDRFRDIVGYSLIYAMNQPAPDLGPCLEYAPQTPDDVAKHVWFIPTCFCLLIYIHILQTGFRPYILYHFPPLSKKRRLKGRSNSSAVAMHVYHKYTSHQRDTPVGYAPSIVWLLIDAPKFGQASLIKAKGTSQTRDR